MSKASKVSEQLRDAILNCGETRYALAKRSGVGEPVLSKFMAGAGLNLETIDKLCEALGMGLVTNRKRK
jgi:hypothetical protein